MSLGCLVALGTLRAVLNRLIYFTTLFLICQGVLRKNFKFVEIIHFGLYSRRNNCAIGTNSAGLSSPGVCLWDALRADEDGANSTRLRRASLPLTLCRPHLYTNVRCLERFRSLDPGNFWGGTLFDLHLHAFALLCCSPLMPLWEFVTLFTIALLTLLCSRRLDGGARRGYRPPP